jgi:hypothetical protein
MTNEELKTQFKRCQKWQDPEQWDLLGMAYYNRGFVLNAGYCFDQADARRLSQVVVSAEAVAI